MYSVVFIYNALNTNLDDLIQGCWKNVVYNQIKVEILRYISQILMLLLIFLLYIIILNKTLTVAAIYPTAIINVEILKYLDTSQIVKNAAELF